MKEEHDTYYECSLLFIILNRNHKSYHESIYFKYFYI